MHPDFHWPNILETDFREFHWRSRKYDKLIASFTDSNFSQWLHLKYLVWFYKRGKWSVKLVINLSYFLNYFCETNCYRPSGKYFVSESWVTWFEACLWPISPTLTSSMAEWFLPMPEVRSWIQSLANLFYRTFMYCQLYWKDKKKEKRGQEWPI